MYNVDEFFFKLLSAKDIFPFKIIFGLKDHYFNSINQW